MSDLSGRSILVTGGTGSFGRAFISTVLRKHKPRKLVVFSRDELKQHEMQSNPSFSDGADILRFYIGDVRDADRLEMAMRDIDVVIHAAALKHVPIAEYNPFECIRTNVHGAENVVSAALRAGVKRVIGLSTDKAVNPVSLYGASKLAADKIFVAANNLAGADGPRFAIVRYGNVLGSRGSVLPLFQRLVSTGVKTLPITDPRMTRFWITLEQSVEFVLSSLSRMHGGELFVPKIPSMRVADLARAVAPDLDHEIIGIRPGEKLHEVLLTEDDSRTTRAFDDRYVIVPMYHFWSARHDVEQLGEPVAEGFRYASDNNEQWLSSADIRKLLDVQSAQE
ncbi:MAG: UDP-N-acetylglucosamine 4,6-dehydratase (inverting) [Pirellulaceae bacterium]|jgi:UDP-N-acetylglucosamine 4,6-dehydratase|nr:UDP-N-acetylglucosamine 4,6-dehydratase (inverting) [Pirellulaceae bacterium]